MNKKQIRLTESELKRVIAESVRRVLREAYDPEEWEDVYIDNKGNIMQSRGTGPNKEWRTIKGKKY